VLAAGLGLLRFIHADWATVGEEIVEHLHLDPDQHVPQVFLQAMSDLSPARIRWLAVFAVLYSTFRFAEAYGLWRERRWGAWVAIASGGLYLPFEIHHLMKGFGWIKLGVTLLNVALVVYLWKFRREDGLTTGLANLDRAT
jgi:uncharacterized membrane protein (DUF2068 family)